jgi:hypothetical protein
MNFGNDTRANPVAASLPATPKLREGGCEAHLWRISKASAMRLTETRLQQEREQEQE